MPTKLTPEIINAAIVGFEQQRHRIDAQIGELKAMLSGGPAEAAATPEPAKRKRRKMSAAGRKAIAEAQRKRWAVSKKAAEPPAAQKVPRPKRKLSPARKAALVANLAKARAARAAKRAEAAKAEQAANKKAAAKKTATKKTAKKIAPIKKAAARAKKVTAPTETVAQTA